MIEHLATGEDFMRVIECPKLQEYDSSKHLVQMYEDAKRELSQEEESHAAHTHDDSDLDLSLEIESEDEVREIMSDGEANKILTQNKKYQYFVVTKEYTKQDATEISLKLGERVKQLLPANVKGMAFGLVKHGMFHKKKKGFYPVHHTQLITTLNAEGNNGKKLKMVQKFQKKVKKAKSKEDKHLNTTQNAPTTSNGQTVSDGTNRVEFVS